MFRMKVESQMNILDRTLICGKPEFDTIPESITVSGEQYKVIGISHGIRLPFMSLEIEKAKKNLIGKNIVEQ